MWPMQVIAGEWGEGFDSGHVRGHALQNDGKADSQVAVGQV